MKEFPPTDWFETVTKNHLIIIISLFNNLYTNIKIEMFVLKCAVYEHIWCVILSSLGAIIANREVNSTIDNSQYIFSRKFVSIIEITKENRINELQQNSFWAYIVTQVIWSPHTVLHTKEWSWVLLFKRIDSSFFYNVKYCEIFGNLIFLRQWHLMVQI